MNAPPRIVVLSRDQARSFRAQVPYIVISIHPPGIAPVKLYPDKMRKGRINLEFNDGAPDWGHDGTADVLMSEQQAARIAAFVGKHLNDTMIVINCMQGISRSAAVAAGIRTGLGFEAEEYELAPYDPNPHVRRLVHAAVRAVNFGSNSKAES